MKRIRTRFHNDVFDRGFARAEGTRPPTSAPDRGAPPSPPPLSPPSPSKTPLEPGKGLRPGLRPGGLRPGGVRPVRPGGASETGAAPAARYAASEGLSEERRRDGPRTSVAGGGAEVPGGARGLGGGRGPAEDTLVSIRGEGIPVNVAAPAVEGRGLLAMVAMGKPSKSSILPPVATGGTTSGERAILRAG